ncbi:MAG: hypothetical protein HRT89_01760 [Lentisphaeria bacterium]|nr:hypothetical protein [Lentisphaeria bacterium]NQZ66772.1 hypothetical protein [Lentisphaeria bacterium]
MSNKSSKGGGGLVFLWAIAGVLVLAAAAEFVGPKKGWISALSKTEQKSFDDVAVLTTRTPTITQGETAKQTTAPKSQNAGSAKPEKAIPVAPPEDEGKTARKLAAEKQAKEAAHLEKLHKQFLKEELAKCRKVRIKKIYTLELKSGERFIGTLIMITSSRAIFTSAKGDRVLEPKQLTQKSKKKLFPKAIAKEIANQRYDREVEKLYPPEEPVAVVRTQTRKTGTPTPRRKANPYAPFAGYDASPAKTPKHLLNVLKQFKLWLDMQNRRSGVGIVTKIWAKQQGKYIVCYMTMGNIWNKVDRDKRVTVCDMYWRMWSYRARSERKVSSTKRAHIVLLDKSNNIVGGSSKNKASNVWVK